MDDTAVIARNGNGNHDDRRPTLAERQARQGEGAEFQDRPVRKLVTAGRQAVAKDVSQLLNIQGELRRPLGRDRNAIEALKTIRDLDPLASDAVFVLLRMLNPGHDLKAYTFLADGSEVEAGEEAPAEVISAQMTMDELARRVGAEYGGGLDQLVNVLGLQVLTHGAVAMEVAPTDDLAGVEDWYPIDPISLSFKRVKTAPDGSPLPPYPNGTERTRLALGQRFAAGKWVELNTEQVFFMPLDPDTDEPYGRPPLLAAVGAVLFLAQMLSDLRAVVHNQGYPRIDVQIMWEILKLAAPPALLQSGQEEEFAIWAQARLDAVVEAYNDLSADDTFVHFDWVTVASTGGALGGSGTFDFKSLEQIMIRQLTAALKTLPILLGINESTSETHGSVQWAIQVAGVEALQKIVKRIVEKAANVSLQLFGHAAHGKMEYEKTRTVDRLFEAQAELIETKTHEEWVAQGWEDNDAASIALTGHAAAGEPGEFGGKLAELEAQLLEKEVNAPPASEGQQPTPTEKQQTTKGGDLKPLTILLLADARRAVAARQEEAPEVFDPEPLIEVFENQAVVIFRGMGDVLIDVLEKEGIELESASRFTLDGQTAKDVADYVFGVRFSREMKTLLRDAIREGLNAGGATEADVDERLVRRVWADNKQYVDRIRDDLKVALKAGSFDTLDDVRRWFETNAYREEMMGRFLAKQGIEGGFAKARTLEKPEAKFRWQLGVVISQHCQTCQERSDNEYTYEELISLGYPGSSHLACGSSCKCMVVEV